MASNKAHSTQRATVTPREGCILLRTEMVRAIIRQDEAVVFPSRCRPPATSPCFCKLLHVSIGWVQMQTRRPSS